MTRICFLTKKHLLLGSWAKKCELYFVETLWNLSRLRFFEKWKTKKVRPPFFYRKNQFWKLKPTESSASIWNSKISKSVNLSNPIIQYTVCCMFFSVSLFLCITYRSSSLLWDNTAIPQRPRIIDVDAEFEPVTSAW